MTEGRGANTPLHENIKVGFLGSGKMAQALCHGFITRDLLPGNRIFASKLTTNGIDQGLLKDLQDRGVTVGTDNKQVVKEANVLIIAVKPHIVPGVLKEVAEYVTSEHLIISVAAGVTLETLQSLLSEEPRRLVRSMPNTPAQVLEGATVYLPGPHASAADVALVETLFSAVGLCERMASETQFDVALSGPGPAFVFLMIEALADGGVKMGLPRATAQRLAAQTLKGAASLAQETGEHPGALKDAVCSPGGTTIAGVHALERSGFRAALMDAVEAATLRARELGKQ